MPVPKIQFLTNNGDPCADCKLYAYAAGTNTPQNTYADVTLATPNENPVELDSAGRATVFLDARLTYKFSLHTAADVPIWTVDSVDAVPSGLNVDVSGVAGEVLAQRQIVYLSSGLDVTTAGRWYLTDADLVSKSSGASLVGVVISTAIGAGSSGTIRIQGRATGFSGLSEGLSYFVSATAGALTSTAPANVKVVGVAESASVLLLTPGAATSGGVGAFSSLQVSGTAANSIDTAGGIEAGSGNVQVVNAAGNVLETAIADGTILARVAANENVTGQWTIANGMQFTGIGAAAAGKIGLNVNQLSFLGGSAGHAFFTSAGGLLTNVDAAGVWTFSPASVRGIVVTRASADSGIAIASTGGSGTSYGITSTVSGALSIQHDADADPAVVLNGAANTLALSATGGIFANNPLTMVGGERLTAVISPPQLAADVNDYNPAGLSTARIIRIDASGGDGEHDISGIAAQAAGTVLTLTNVGASGKFTLKAVSGSSSAANRLAMVSDIGLSAPVGGGASVDRSSISIWYDGASSVWRTLD